MENRRWIVGRERERHTRGKQSRDVINDSGRATLRCRVSVCGSHVNLINVTGTQEEIA